MDTASKFYDLKKRNCLILFHFKINQDVKRVIIGIKQDAVRLYLKNNFAQIINI
jgi:hypothetical protein